MALKKRFLTPFLSFLCVFVVWTAACEAIAASTASFFRPSRQPLPSKAGIGPGVQTFGIGLYSIMGNSKVDPKLSNMRRAAQNGFTIAGPYYHSEWRDFGHIYAAAREGMKVTFQIRPPESLVGVPMERRAAELNKLTDAQMAASIRQQVSAVLNDAVANNTVARWSLGLEEVRYWQPAEMRYLKVARDTIRAVEKARGVSPRPLSMYEPANRHAAALVKTGLYQDIVNKGVYLTGIPRGEQRAGYAIWSYTQIVRAASQLGTIPQATLELSKDFTDPKTGKNPAEIRRVLRHDTYLGLVMGIKTVNIWSMFEDRPNLTTHNEQFLAYASVARELTGNLQLGKVFLFGEPRRDLLISVRQGAKRLSYRDQSGNAFTYDTLHYLNTAVDNQRYLFLVNSSEQPMEVRIQGLPSSYLLDDLFAGTTTAMTQTSLSWRLDVLGVAALRIRQNLVSAIAGRGGLSIAAVPEPSAWTLALCSGLVGLFVRHRR